jgi:hypothetical protein
MQTPNPQRSRPQQQTRSNYTAQAKRLPNHATKQSKRGCGINIRVTSQCTHIHPQGNITATTSEETLLQVNKLVDHRPYHIHTHNSLHMIQVPASTYAYDNSATFYSIAASSLYRIHFDQRLFKKQNSCLVLSVGVG